RIRGSHAKTTSELLANLEHEFWLPWHSIRLGIANGQYEPDLQVSRSEGRRYPIAVACRAADRIYRATDYWRCERSDLGTAWQAAAVFPRRRDIELDGASGNAELQRALDGGGLALDFGRINQCVDGAISCVRCG